MDYDEFREKFECDFIANIEDYDNDGERIIKPDVVIAVPKEDECVKKCFGGE